MIAIAIAIAIGASCAGQFYLRSMNRYNLLPPKREAGKELRDPRLSLDRPATCGQVVERQTATAYERVSEEYRA